MADRFYTFRQTPEQLRSCGARGGRVAARNRRARRSGASSPSVDTVSATDLTVETTAGDIASLDAQFPWLRGAERRLPARSRARRNTQSTRALTAEREKPMQESIPSGVDLMTLPLSADVEIPQDAGCANCGSSNIEPFESYNPTGVHAPDGSAEYQNETGVHCLDCEVKAAPEPREWLGEAFQIVAGTSRVRAQREHLVAVTLHFRELVSALFEVPTPKEAN
jgi:hypothetical protein